MGYFQRIESQDDGLCILESGSDTRITLRLQSRGAVALDHDSTGLVVVWKGGVVAIDSDKLLRTEGVALIAGDTRVELRGTRVLLTGGKEKVRVDVLDGKVAISRSPENLFYGDQQFRPQEIRERLSIAGGIPPAEIEVEKGERVHLPILSAELKSQKEEIQAWVQDDASAPPRDTIPTEASPILLPTKQSIAPGEIKHLEGFTSGSEPVHREPRSSQGLETRSQTPPPPSRQEPAKPAGFQQTLHTKDGKIYVGVIRQSGGFIIIQTSQGVVRVADENVESIGFANGN